MGIYFAHNTVHKQNAARYVHAHKFTTSHPLLPLLSAKREGQVNATFFKLQSKIEIKAMKADEIKACTQSTVI